MPAAETTSPIEDSVAKVDNEIAVGADLEFQRKWWRFTRVLWIVFGLIIVADLLGCFGRGILANASLRSPDGSMNARYERIERFSTPSILRIEFSAAAIHNGQIKLWVSDSLVKPLGNQRIIPQPANSILENGGILYTFPASTIPATVEFALEPAAPGIYDLTFKLPGSQPLTPRIYVMP
jgi:hypothetical protein